MGLRPTNRLVSRLYQSTPINHHSKYSKRIVLCQQLCYLKEGSVQVIDLIPFLRSNVQYGKSRDKKEFLKKGHLWVELTNGMPCL